MSAGHPVDPPYLVSASTPALDAAEAATKPEPVLAYVVEIDRKLAPFCALIRRLPMSSLRQFADV